MKTWYKESLITIGQSTKGVNCFWNKYDLLTDLLDFLLQILFLQTLATKLYKNI